MLIGYARVSTQEQSLELQLEALREAGCEKIFHDIASGSKGSRPGLAAAMEIFRPGDVLVVWKMDRLGRSLQHLIEVINDLQTKRVGFRSITQNLDTTTPGGMLIFHVFGAVAEFERELIRERTHAGLANARARGRLGGRPRAMNEQRSRLATSLYNSKDLSIDEICQSVGVSRATLYRHLAGKR